MTVERFLWDNEIVASAEQGETIKQMRAKIERLRGAPVWHWEVDGFIDRLIQRDDTNSERLILEAISHLREFSRECDELRAANAAMYREIERLRTAVIWHCEACGTVTRTEECDCTRMETGTQRLVPYDYVATRDAEIEWLRAELADWKQAASVEAGLRREFLERAEKADAEIERLRALIQCLLDENPNDLAADGGITVLDVWRKEARRALESKS